MYRHCEFDSCAKVGVLGVGQYNGIIQTESTHVAMVTKFSHVATEVWRLQNSGGRSSRWALPRLLVSR